MTDPQDLKTRIAEDTKGAMRARDKARLAVLRLISAAVKQREVDERIELDDSQVLAVLDKMLKQRKDSIAQYEQAGREDLKAQEVYEVEIIQTYLPAQLEESEIDALIAAAIADTGAESAKDMGKVMGILKPQLAGRADMKAVSARVRAALS